MKASERRKLEGKLIEALQRHFGDPEANVPQTLRDQPTEVVYTALQPKREPKQRSGLMEFGGMPAMPGESSMGNPDAFQDPMTTGQATIEAMMGDLAGQGAAPPPSMPMQQPAQPQAAMEPQARPQRGSAPPMQETRLPSPGQRPEDELMQQLLVSG